MTQNVKVFPASGRAQHRYPVDYQCMGRWVLDATYRTYLMARLQVSVWNSIGTNARIVDTREVAD